MESYPIKCDQCCAYSINGHAVHEAASCPNDKYPWKIEDGLCVPDKTAKYDEECDHDE